MALEIIGSLEIYSPSPCGLMFISVAAILSASFSPLYLNKGNFMESNVD